MRRIYNSSITRIRPVFRQLIHQDGNAWLKCLLSLGQGKYAQTMAQDPGELLPNVRALREYKDSDLQQKGIDLPYILLENCFEVPVAPPEAFLAWMLENHQHLKWPVVKGKPKQYSETAEIQRRALLAGDPAAKAEALRELERLKAKGSRRKWWAFEGFTSVDCLIETDKLVLAIEGKRTEEGPSQTIDWFTERDQLVRNLEALKQLAAGKPYGVMLIQEKATEVDTQILFPDLVQKSLPHYSRQDAEELMTHFLGVTTWKQLCEATGIDYLALPDTIVDAAAGLKAVSLEHGMKV